MPTTVVNRRFDDYDVYIGRGSKWGNPFSHLPGVRNTIKVRSRSEAIREYAAWVVTQDHLMEALPELAGKRLGCYCKPRDCHGDVLVELLEGGPYA